MNKQFETVVIEDGVVEIGWSAFCNVQAKSIRLPETLTRIGKTAFERNCASAIFIPKNVCSITGDAFSWCDCLNRISVDEDNEYYRAAPDHKTLIEKTLPDW